MQSPFLLMGTPCSGWALPQGGDPAASCYHGNSSCALASRRGWRRGEEAVCSGSPWTFCGGNPYIQRNWKMMFAISGPHKVRSYSLPLSPSAISIPGLCGKRCCAVSVSRELPCRDGPVRSSDATAGCGAQGCALQAVVEPCTAHRVPRGAQAEDAKRRGKFRGKCQANAFCWPAGSCVARELFLAELAQRLFLPPLANFHKLLWNTGSSQSSVTGPLSSALQLCGEDLKPHSS